MKGRQLEPRKEFNQDISKAHRTNTSGAQPEANLRLLTPHAALQLLMEFSAAAQAERRREFGAENPSRARGSLFATREKDALRWPPNREEIQDH